MNIKKFSLALAVTVLFALFIGVAYGEEAIYPVEKWYYQYEFNDDTLQGKDYFEGDAGNGDKWPFPVIESFDGEGVATFDTEKVAKNARIGFSLKKDTANYLDMKSALENGEELCIEMKIYNDGDQKKHAYFFFDMLYIRNEGFVYFCKYDNEPGKDAYAANLIPSRSLKTGWHTISLVLFSDDGVLKCKNFEIDGKFIDKVYTMSANMSTPTKLLLRDNASLFFVNKEDEAVTAKMHMDYLRVYTVKALKSLGADFEDNKKVSKSLDKVNMKFNYPIDSESAQTRVKVLNPDGDEMDISSGTGSDEKTLSITFNEPFEYSNCYKIVVEDLEERDDKVKYSGEYEFYIENEPLYQLENMNVSQKTIDVRCAVPMEQKLYFSALIYDASGKLLDAEFSREIAISKDEAQTFKTVDFMTKNLPSGAAKIKLFVFDSELDNVYRIFNQDI